MRSCRERSVVGIRVGAVIGAFVGVSVGVGESVVGGVGVSIGVVVGVFVISTVIGVAMWDCLDVELNPNTIMFRIALPIKKNTYR